MLISLVGRRYSLNLPLLLALQLFTSGVLLFSKLV
ncbi:uncharacterized protein J3R85_003905 [Psidium guajava]|nr:uncharacterized protein J3R85_003905 [Psidium guajava]